MNNNQHGVVGADIKPGDWVTVIKPCDEYNHVEITGTVEKIVGNNVLINHEWGTCWAPIWALKRLA